MKCFTNGNTVFLKFDCKGTHYLPNYQIYLGFSEMQPTFLRPVGSKRHPSGCRARRSQSTKKEMGLPNFGSPNYLSLFRSTYGRFLA